MTHRTIIAAHYAAAEQGDLAGMMENFDSQILWIEAAGFSLSGEYRGPDQVARRVFAAIATDWEGFGMDVDEMLEDGDTVIVVGHYVGRHRRTSRDIHARTVHIWRLSGNAIVGFEQLTDTYLIAEAADEDRQ